MAEASHSNATARSAHDPHGGQRSGDLQQATAGAVLFHYDGEPAPLQVTSLHGIETLGAPHHFELELLAARPLDGAEVLGKAAVLTVRTALGAHRWHGAIDALVAIATAGEQPGRHYRVTLCGGWAELSRNRRRRVWQQLSAPDIIEQLFEEAGVSAPKLELSAQHAPYEYLTQFDESDATFLRRLLEQDGLWLRRSIDDDDGLGNGSGNVDAENHRASAASWALCDNIDGAPEAAALEVIDGAGFNVFDPCAWDVAIDRRRAVGKVSLGSFDAAHPTLSLMEQVAAGSDAERGIEHYHHRASRLGATARDGEELKTAACRHLAALRAGHATVSFCSNVAVSAGARVTLSGPYEAEVFVTQLTSHWQAVDSSFRFEVVGVPVAAGFALPRRTLKPMLSGACLATVTGAAGEEVDCDALGRVRLRFHWDRTGRADDSASLPVRVAHPQMAGSLLIPRAGWEVVVMFEDGDPDCPYVLGRLDNGQHRPAAALPANKTMTRLATYSSPAAKDGSGGANVITMEDAAGRQGFGIVAAKGMSITVAGDMLAQTVAVDELRVDADQSLSVGGNQTIAVQPGAFVDSCASQSIVVGGDQSFQTPKAMALSAEAVTVSAASLSEQVGSAGGGLGDLAKTAAFTAVGSFGGAKGMALATGAKALAAYQQGGGEAAAGELLKTAASMVPGVGTAVAVAEGSGGAPWQRREAEEGGGAAEDASSAAGGAQGGSGAEQGGGGKRITVVGGSMMESIGGGYIVNTPGSSSWTTMGLRNLAIGGTHNIAAGMYSFQTLGAASVVAPALNISSAGTIVRTGRLMKLSVAGALSSTSAGDTVLSGGGGLKLSAGALKMEGTVVLVCGAAKVTISSGGIVAEAPSVTFASSTKAAEATQ